MPSRTARPRTKKYAELSATEKIQANCDVKATNIIFHRLPSDVYVLVNDHRVAKDLWERIQLLMQGTSLTKQEKECKLYDEFDKFAYIKGASLHQYCLRFVQLINNMNIYKMTLHQFIVNTKFLNSLPPEWSKFVMNVKLVRDLQTTNFDQLHAYLQQHKLHANEIDSGLVVPVFKQGDDPIDAINKMMSFLSTVVTSRFPSIINQLRNSFKPRQQATIHDGKVTWQESAQSLRGKEMLRDPGIAEGPVTQTVITNNATYQANYLDACDSDCDDITTAKVALMANLSRYSSDVLSEGIDDLSFDDLYDNMRVFESDIKGSNASSSSLPNNLLVLTKPRSNATTAIKLGTLQESVDSKPVHIQEEEKEEASGTRTAHADDEDGDFALMAFNNTSSDTEIISCSPKCVESYSKLKKLYDEQRDQLSDANVEILAYSQGLKKVEAQLVTHQNNQLWYEQKIRYMKIDLDDKTNVLTYHKKLLAEALKEKEDLKTKFANWQNSSKNLSKLLNTQMSANDKFGLGYGDYRFDGILSYENEVLQSMFFNNESNSDDSTLNVRFAKPDGMHVVPPPMIGNYMPSGPDVEIDESQFTYVLTRSGKIPINTARSSGTNHVNIARQNVSTARPNCPAVPTRTARIVSTDDPQRAMKNKGIVDNGCSRHMTGNKSYLVDYQYYNGGPVAFRGSKGQITDKTDNAVSYYLDFDDVCFVKELQQFNLFSISQMYDKKNKSSYTSTIKSLEVKSSDKVPDEDIVLNKNEEPEEQVFLNELEQLKRQEKDARNAAEALRNDFTQGIKDLLHQAGATNATNTNKVSTDGPSVSTPSAILITGGPSVSTDSLIVSTGGPYPYENDSQILALKDMFDNTGEGIFTNASYDDEVEPKKISDALEDESWVDAMQEELLQFKIQKVWIHVDLPKGKKTIRLKWVYKNKKDERDPMHSNKVYKVVKALYGLHQAPKAWYATLSTFLLKNGYRRGAIDKTLFIKKDKKDIILVQVYVDDIIFGSTKKSWCDEFEALMKSKFQMSSMGKLTFFLGLQVKQKEDGIFISQDKYVTEILKKFDYMNVKTASTPIETQRPLTKDEEAANVDVHLYRSMISSLMYLTALRPDIMFAVCNCSRFQVTPKTSYLNAVKRIFRYLKGKPKLGLWYPRVSPFDLEAYSDSDYAGVNLDRKFTTGDCRFLGRRLISWQCKKQTIVATSTTKVEYVIAASCCGQVLWIQNQMLDYGFNFMNTKIHIDNESTICIVKNLVFHSKTKHIEIRHHFIRDAFEKKMIQVLKIHTDNNVADLLTKAFDAGSSWSWIGFRESLERDFDGEPSAHKDPAFEDFEDLFDVVMDYQRTKEVKDKDSTNLHQGTGKEKVSTNTQKVSTDRAREGTDTQKVSTNSTKLSTDKDAEGTDGIDDDESKASTTTVA
ncbi:putative ribonuclease H-like domain-containing protein [Tanacetum coccineum]